MIPFHSERADSTGVGFFLHKITCVWNEFHVIWVYTPNIAPENLWRSHSLHYHQMNILYKRFILLASVLFIAGVSYAQQRGGQFAPIGKISGQVVDSSSGDEMEYVTISVIAARKDSAVDGGITDNKGFFDIEGLGPGMYRVVFNFIGYRPTTRSVRIGREATEIYLDKVGMDPDEQTLEAAKVVASSRKVTYDIDKKVVNVSDLNTVMSESATEILQNVPGVSVGIDGEVSLRGSNSFTLLIDGKPTVLDISDALQQIPASTIESVEIITNPSAKYEAEGSSGIVNIVLKRNKLKGFSGLINANGGTYDSYGGNAVLSYNKKKVTVNLTGNVRQRTRPEFEESIRTTELARGFRSQLFSEGESNWIHGGYGLNGELIYRINPKSTISVGGQIGTHNMKSYSDQSFLQRTYQMDSLTNTFEYTNEQDWYREGFGGSANIDYSYLFKGNREHRLDIRGVLRLRDGEEESISTFVDPTGITQGGYRVTEVGPNNNLRFNIDYVRPISANFKIETGSQIEFSQGADQTESFTYVPTEETFPVQPNLTYTVDYDRNIYAGYLIGTGKVKKLGYTAGLRGEYTDRLISVREIGDAKIERMDYFPTVHFSYELPKKMQTLLSYSRRIQRPRSWYLEPFTIWNDAYNARSGNPELKPEYIDAYEVSWIKDFNKGTSVSAELYHRKRSNNIERVRTSLDSNVVLTFPANAGNSYTSGLELMTNQLFFNVWRVDLSGSFYDYRVKGTYGDLEFDNQSFSYNLRWNNTLTLKNSKFQIEQSYQSRIVTAQGERVGFWTANASWRQSFMKNALATTLQVRDIFSTIKNDNTVVGNQFSSDNYSEPRTPTISLAVSVKINNYKQQMSRGSRGGEGGDDEF